MSKRDPKLFVAEMITACDKIGKFISGLQESDFYNDELVQDAVLRNLEVIGEAARQLSDDVRNRYPDVPWTRVASDVTSHTMCDATSTSLLSLCCHRSFVTSEFISDGEISIYGKSNRGLL